MIFFIYMNNKAMMLKYYRDGLTSDDFPEDNTMSQALYTYETYGDATRDNTFEQMVSLGQKLLSEPENS